jgi:hypothetical protein
VIPCSKPGLGLSDSGCEISKRHLSLSKAKLEEAKISPFENVVQKIDTNCGEYLNGMGLEDLLIT